jgi:hypothetical protein
MAGHIYGIHILLHMPRTRALSYVEIICFSWDTKRCESPILIDLTSADVNCVPIKSSENDVVVRELLERGDPF